VLVDGKAYVPWSRARAAAHAIANAAFLRQTRLSAVRNSLPMLHRSDVVEALWTSITSILMWAIAPAFSYSLA
jgi:hypothetical protein